MLLSGLRYIHVVKRSGLTGELQCFVFAPLRNIFKPSCVFFMLTVPRHSPCLCFFSCSVDKLEEMIGSFGPRGEPYTKRFATEEAPSGMLARSGLYTVRSRVLDDDGNVYADWCVSRGPEAN